MKLIFLDIDGTLTEPGCNVPPESALKAIRAAQKKGNKVFLCTGRNYNMLEPLIQYEFDGIIGSSGGYVEVDKKVIYDRPFTKEQTEKAMDILKRHQIFRTVECYEGAYTDDGLKEFLRENADQGSNSELLRWREQIESSLNIRSMAEYQNQPIYKIVMMSMQQDNLLAARDEFDDSFTCVIQEVNANGICNGELISSEYDKGIAVLKVCEALHVAVEDTYGFGDSMNDLEMIETVGTAVVMENGSSELKKHADFVCPSCSQDGLLKAFMKYDLI